MKYGEEKGGGENNEKKTGSNARAKERGEVRDRGGNGIIGG
jgi:hypothetical protein